jgi:membrane protein
MSMLPFKEWWPLGKKAASAWLEDYAPSMGAALSYYTVFSLAPMLLIVIAVAGLVFGQDAARGALLEQLSGLMGADAAQAVRGILESASKPSEGVLASVSGVVVLLIGATTVFAELQDAFDRIWRSPAKAKGTGLWGLLRTRLLSFGMILGIGFLLIVSLVVETAVSALGKWWSPVFGGWEMLAHTVTFLFGLCVSTLAFAMIYKLMPRAKVEWHDVWIGAFVTAVLFSLGRFLIAFYIGKSGVASGFGAAGSLAIVFIWVYYSAQIFLLGAEFTWVYANAYGSMKHLAKMEQAMSPVPPSRTDTSAAPAAGAAIAPGRASTDHFPWAEQRRRAPRIPEQSLSTSRIARGVAVAVALRYLVPWVLRRMARR